MLDTTKIVNPIVISQAYCQIDFSRALKWGIVHLCTLNTFRDTMDFRQLLVFYFLHFRKKIVKSVCKIAKNAKIQKLTLSVFDLISPMLLDLKRQTIPHFKDNEKIFWTLAWSLTVGLTTFALFSKTFENFFMRHPLRHKELGIKKSRYLYILKVKIM